MNEIKDPNYVQAMKGLTYEPIERIAAGKKIKKTVLPTELVFMPKLNGIRVRWDVESQCLRTNNGIMVQSCDHIVKQILATRWMKHLPIDGEMYHHDHDAYTFSYINGKVRRKSSSAETEFLQFHIFELAMFGNADFDKAKRLQLIEKLFQAEENLGEHLIRVSYKHGYSFDVESYFRECLKDKYEGIMISDRSGIYTTGKGKWMWKFKPVHSAEHKFVRLVPALEGRNMKTFAAIELMMEDGQIFTCSGISDKRRMEIFKNPPAVEAPITIEFGDWSDTGIPIFPRYVDERFDL